MKIHIAAIITCSLFIQVVHAETTFPAIDVSPQKAPKLKFHFSTAPASSASPVVITLPKISFTDKHRVYRIELQKHWLSVNVPKNYIFRSRALTQCEFARPGEFAAADKYDFEDPETGEIHAYYIYVGNWPS